MLMPIHTQAQCTGCTSTVNSNSNITVNSGQTVCLTFSGNYNRTITVNNGGTLCISAATNVTSGATISYSGTFTIINNGSVAAALNNFNSGTFNNNGTFTGTLSMGGGTFNNNGTANPSSVTFNSGNLTNNTSGSVTIPNGTNFNSGFTFTNNGNATMGGFTVNAGATVNLNGTQTITGNVSNNNNLTISAGTTITGTFANNGGGTATFGNGITITGATTNNGTINLTGNLTINNNYLTNSPGTIRQLQSGCNTLSISGTNTGNGNFNGNTNGFIINTAPGSSGQMTNGASAPLTAPTQQPTGLSLSFSGANVNGSFTSPSASINGYIVLGFAGASAPTDNPVSYANYSVGSTVGSSRVVAIVTGGVTGTLNFTDNTVAPTATCGQNVYYRIFSFNGSGACRVFLTASPLTGSIAKSAPASATATSNSPVALGGTLNLSSSATGGSTYSWSGPASFTSATQNPTRTSYDNTFSGTYTVTITGGNGCTATASTVVSMQPLWGAGTSPRLWLKANALSQADGSGIATWVNSVGGNNLAQSTPANQPIFNNTSANYINFYPVATFNGTSQAMTAASFSGTSSYNQAHFFVVAKAANNTQTSSLVYEDQATVSGEGGRINLHLPWSGLAYWDAGTCCGNNRLTSTFAASSTNVPVLWSFSKDLAGTANGTQQQDIRSNGLTVATKATNTLFTGNNSTFFLGSTSGGNNYAGQVAEVIYYLGATINAATQNRIESYLATKYGITLDQTSAQNYTSSVGTVYWNAAANGTFKNNIFGVGVDNPIALSQTQSVSINTNMLTITGATALTDGSFLMLSDDNGSASFSRVTGLPNSFNIKLNRTWRASQTGVRGNVTLRFDGSTAGLSPLSPYLLIDSNGDGTFESWVAATTVSGAVSTYTTSFRDGARFTIAFTATIDYGDAMGTGTPSATGGAGHLINPIAHLGSLVDADADGIPSPNCLSDDTTGVNDDDGVDFNIGVATNGNNILQVGVSNSIRVVASVAGFVSAWIDYDQNQTFSAAEQVIANFAVTPGVNILTFTPGDSVDYGPTAFRIRYGQNLSDVANPTGLAGYGEVEDYKVYLTAPLVSACSNGFQNPGFEMRPMIAANTYLIYPERNMPYWKTTATDGMMEMWSTPFNGVSAYEGIHFMELNANLFGALYQDIYTQPGTVFIWHFAHRGRAGVDSCNLKIGPPGATVQVRKVGDGNTAWGVYEGSYTVPANQYITRFEFNAVSTANGNLSVGNFLDDVFVSSSFDYGDAPASYYTLRANNGPYHNMTTDLRLGANESCDADGQPGTAATSDTYDDGVTFPVIAPSATSFTVTVSVYNNTGTTATVNGWIDFNRNGVFDAGERVSTTVPSSATQQSISMTFSGMTYGGTNPNVYARFRIGTIASEVANPTGFASDGEVEDYKIDCAALPLPTPTNNGPLCTRQTLNLTAGSVAPWYRWVKSGSTYTSTAQNPTISVTALSDSGTYRVYAYFANGCATDSATRVIISNCTMSVAGTMFDDRNGDGIRAANDTLGTVGQTVYAVLRDTNNVVLATQLVNNTTGVFSFSGVPAYTSGMSIAPATSNPAIGSTYTTPTWPANWVGTAGNLGTNNQIGTGIYGTVDYVPVTSAAANITGIWMGYDRLPSATPRTYNIARPAINSTKVLRNNTGLGILLGRDPEDAAVYKFVITSLAGMNGNQLYYDLNGDGVLNPSELVTAGQTILNYDSSKLIIKFSGAGSTSASFTYASSDSAFKIGTGSTYYVSWLTGLPVKMLFFTAEKQGNSGLLKWSTAAEIENHHFDVMRSADGQDWTAIGTVAGNGTTAQQHDYSFLDRNPLSGENYYQLKQFDEDGHYNFSTIVQLTFDAAVEEPTATARLFPLPVLRNGTVQLEVANTSSGITSVQVLGMNGQTVRELMLDGTPETTSASLALEGLDTGNYIVNITMADGTKFQQRLLIQ